MKPVLIVLGVAALAGVVGAAMGVPHDSLAFFVGGALLLATILTLAVDRYVLSRYDHLLFPTDATSSVPLHRKLRTRMRKMDRWGVFLTIGLVIYGVAFAVYLAIQLYEAIIESVFRTIRHV